MGDHLLICMYLGQDPVRSCQPVAKNAILWLRLGYGYLAIIEHWEWFGRQHATSTSTDTPVCQHSLTAALYVHTRHRYADVLLGILEVMQPVADHLGDHFHTEVQHLFRTLQVSEALAQRSGSEVLSSTTLQLFKVLLDKVAAAGERLQSKRLGSSRAPQVQPLSHAATHGLGGLGRWKMPVVLT